MTAPSRPHDQPGSARPNVRQATESSPLVSVLITAYNRPDELRTTLRELRRQDYPALELIVIDDASSVDLEPIVRAEWPNARFTRNSTNAGYIVSRSVGMARATGEFILTLDDDSHPVAADAISRSVARFSSEPQLGVLAFRVHEGPDLPPPTAVPTEQYTFAFIGCGEMMRADVVRAVGGYRDEFEYYKEEAEYSLRVLNRGWRILYFPEIVVHHRLSTIGRSSARIAAYSLRNDLWTVLLNLPVSMVAVEFPWKALVGGVELARRGSPRWLAWAAWSTVRGLPRIVQQRAPMSRETGRLYQALRFRRILTERELVEARAPTWRERVVWFRSVWLRRRRPRAFWDRRPGAVGEGAWTTRARPD